MSNYRQRYDEKLSILLPEIDNLPARIDEIIPGISRPNLRRFFHRFSLLLGRIDKSGSKNPQFLAYGNTNLPEYLISSLDAVVDALRAGPENFFSHKLNDLVWEQMLLERAVGVSSDELKNLTISIAEDLRSTLAKSEESLQQLRAVNDESKALQADLRQAQSEARKAASAASASLESIENLRIKMERLASSDGRTKDSLDSLIKSVRSKADDANNTAEEVQNIKEDIKQHQSDATNALGDARQSADRINDIEQQAKKVLNLSTQAGLAASYLKESVELRKRANLFTILLYGTSIATILVAAFYVLPSLEHAMTIGKKISDALPVVLLRASVLAPLIYVFYFTTKQINSIEILRMDYAEKAAASLAYSGYKDEMAADQSLLERLRASLLLRFAEHPERLLRKRPSQEKLQVEAPGFKATASTADYPKDTAPPLRELSHDTETKE